MRKLTATPIDHKNIGLAKLLFGLRQDLDVYCLISANAKSIDQRSFVKFFGHLQELAKRSVVLGICQIYEEEKWKGYELNSIGGVFHVLEERPKVFDDSRPRGFIQEYDGPSDLGSPTQRLQLTIDGFRDRYRNELNRFKAFRDKKAAHSEYAVTIDSLPSYHVMEKLFFFGADFYDLISAAFVGVGPCDLRTNRPVKISLKKLLDELGLEGSKTDMQ